MKEEEEINRQRGLYTQLLFASSKNFVRMKRGILDPVFYFT